LSVITAALAAGAAAFAGDTSSLAPGELGAGDRFGESLQADGATVVVGAPLHDSDAIADAGAAFVFARMGVLMPQQTELRALDASEGAHFGSAVAVSRDTIAVGAPDASGGGAVYVFERAHGVWSQTAKLDGASSGDRLGAAVAIAGDTIVAGAPARHSSDGAVFVFVRSGTDWTQQAEITDAQGAFGTSVGIRGERLVAGAPLASSSRGTAAVFVRSGETWTLETSIESPDVADGDEAGGAVAIGDDWLAVGAAKSEVGDTTDAGAVDVFLRDNGTWVHSVRLVAPVPEDGAKFGSALALDGGALVVGSPRRGADGADAGGVDVFGLGGAGWTFAGSTPAPGAAAGDLHGTAVTLSEGCVVSGAPGRDGGAAFAQWATLENEVVAADGESSDSYGWSVAMSGDTALIGAPSDDDTGTDAGSVYVFSRSAGVWTERQELTSPDVAANGQFGWSVALSGDTALVGAPFDDDGSATGSAYVFTRTDGVWTQQQRLMASDGAADDHFGWSVALSGNRAIIGAPDDDDNGDHSGTVYAFTRADGVWTEQQVITAADAAESDHFGISVALDAETAIVGADYDDLSGSAYVLVLSDGAWTQQQKLTDPDGRDAGWFGHSVAVSGNTALVGAPGDGASNYYPGKACVFVRSGAGWTLQQTLAASDSSPDDGFGDSVALRGEMALVGAPSNDAAADAAGSAYLFVRSGSVWTQRQQFTPTAGMAGDLYGSCVALSQDTALACAAFDDVGGTDAGSATFWRIETRPWGTGGKLVASDGSAGDELGWTVAISGDTALVGARSDDEAGAGAGSAYVFVRSAGVWTEQQKLTAPEAAADDQFGCSVALSDDTALVGAPNRDEGAEDAGAAYVFVRSAGVWSLQQALTAPEAAAQRRFGRAVALEGDTAVVGTSDDTSAGSAYVFVRTDGAWTEQQALTASDGAQGDLFGVSVALSGNTALVGAIGDSDNGTWSGSAYVFVRSGDTWTEQDKLVASDAATNQYFGCSVALSGDTALVGAAGDSSGVSGAAFVFQRSGGEWTEQRKLTADVPAIGDSFGVSVALHGDVALAGSMNQDGRGAAFVFVRTPDDWVQLRKLTASDAALGEELGLSVALSADTALVGAPHDCEKGDNAGAAYVFDFIDPRPAPFVATPGDLPAAWTIGRTLAAAGAASGGTAPFQWSVASGDLPGGISLDPQTGSLSGTPDATGNFSFSIDAYDAWGVKSSASDSITINVAPAVPAATLPAWTATCPYGSAIESSGGTPPLTFDVASGDVPPGMTLGSGGLLEGVPTTPGSYTFDARVTDAAGATATGSISVTINPEPAITTTDLRPWTEGRPYDQTLGSSGGTPPLTWSVASGALPVDAPIDATNGAITGTALAAGDYTFVAQVTDAAGATATQTVTMTMNPVPAVTTASLRSWTEGRPYDETLGSSGGTSPLTWSVVSGNLPVDAPIGETNGALTGTALGAGDYTFVARVTDAAGATATRTVTVTVNPVPAVPAATLPAWTVNRPYGNAIGYSGGTTPFTFAVASGDVPPGMTLTQGGSLEGVPATPGSYTFGARVTDAAGATATGSISVTINPEPSITTAGLRPWTEGRPYDETLRSSGGTQPLTWSVVSGTRPIDAPIDATTGAIRGTTLAAGDYTFVAQVTDAAGATATRTFTVKLNLPPSLSETGLPAAARGRSYRAGPAVSGGTGSIRWAITSGTIPDGLTLDTATGQLTGTPVGEGSTTLVFRVTDAAGAAAARSYLLVVAPLCDLGKGEERDRFVLAAGHGGKDLVHYVELLGGTKLDMNLVLRTRTGASAELLLLDENEQPLDLSKYRKTTKHSVTVKGFPVPATGRYFVVVRPEAKFVGTLNLGIVVSEDKKWTGQGTLDSAGSPVTFDFCALPGSKLVVTTKGSKNSAAVPTIVSAKDDAGNELLDPQDVTETAKGAVLHLKTPLTGGDYHLTIASRGASAGDVEWTVRLMSPKGYVFSLPDVAIGDE
jgi:hypothetical protein